MQCFGKMSEVLLFGGETNDLQMEKKCHHFILISAMWQRKREDRGTAEVRSSSLLHNTTQNNTTQHKTTQHNTTLGCFLLLRIFQNIRKAKLTKAQNPDTI